MRLVCGLSTSFPSCSKLGLMLSILLTSAHTSSGKCHMNSYCKAEVAMSQVGVSGCPKVRRE